MLCRYAKQSEALSDLWLRKRHTFQLQHYLFFTGIHAPREESIPQELGVWVDFVLSVGCGEQQLQGHDAFPLSQLH